ncbi:MarR family winged helix-turn-helix transcriptional regulator [Roseibium marinum]|uniref:DNA-binding MarR family transcriptional regulator n=1 Tax=Roseibium marinum TaxID=281252 RepID=A0A2S3UL00_9HYPH|nr:MarR family transcriptional regulator [Roseibium marinum]POF28408.1 DNA-binding MarR family transcriptional regulator [Roseibium marinum]
MKKSAPEPAPENGALSISDRTLRAFFGYQMKRTFNLIQSDLNRTLKPFDLRMLTYTALVLVVDNPGLSQAQLAEAMDIERPNLVVIIDELERRELIIRDRLPKDRRAYALKVTLAGRRLYEKSFAAVSAHEKTFLRGVEAEALAVAMDVMRRVEKNRKRDA